MSMDALTSAVLDSLRQALLGPLQEHLKNLSHIPPADRQPAPELAQLLGACIQELQTLQDWTLLSSQLEQVAGDLALEVEDLLGAKSKTADPQPIDEISEREAIDSLLPDFHAAVEDLLDHMLRQLCDWEQHPRDPGYPSEILRIMHTIKGTAGMFQQDKIVEVSYYAESILTGVSGGESQERVHEIIAVLYRVHDHLQKSMSGKESAMPHAEMIADIAKIEQVPTTVIVDDRVRISPREIDRLLELSGDVAVEQHRLAELIRTHSGILPPELRPSHIEPALQTVTSRIHTLQDQALKLRMVPIGDTLQQCRPIARDVERVSGKKIDLTIEGVDTLLDRKIVKKLSEPLIHLVRNACDHGIEHREIRLANGKASAGHVSIKAEEIAGSIRISVQDDGQGIDHKKIRRVADARGIVPLAKTLTTRQTQELIFAPGFSTADSLTRISGRGVGMDIVRQKIDEIGGSISIDSFAGKGTTFEIHVPLTLALAKSLLVTCGDESFAIPVDSLERTMRVRPEQLDDLGAHCVLSYGGKALPIIDLQQVVGATCAASNHEYRYIVILKRKDFHFGLQVGKLHQHADLMVKPFSMLLGETAYAIGAAQLPSGDLTLILDPTKIYRQFVERPDAP